MRVIFLTSLCIVATLALPSAFQNAIPCDTNACLREKGCVCSNTKPSLPTKDIPQFVTITVDDSITAYVYDEFYSKLLFNRKNPDGTPVGATFYVPHQYTDYEKINSLYNKGFDIGVHSITKNTTNYWETATVKQMVDEFQGQRTIISKFANVPITDIKGVRSPHFILSGDTTFKAYTQSGLEYDSSWPTRSDQQLYPYTLDYKTTQMNPIGRTPAESYPGFWILPNINFVGSVDQCNTLFGCQVSGSTEEIHQWLHEQFERTYTTSKAPITIVLNSVWLEQPGRENFNGLELFLDDIGKLKDVYLVSHKEVVAWSKKPVSLEEYKTSTTTKSKECNAITCPLRFGEFEVRYMRTCVQCPAVYPWIGDPLGTGK